MLKLYYSPGACSISPHIALRESGLPFELSRVDFTRGKAIENGKTLSDVNPKGQVPVLMLNDGQLLTEGAAMVQYIADLAPESKIAPPPGSFERVRLQEWLNFIATELHKGLVPIFSPEASDDFKASVKKRVAQRFAFMESALANKPFLLGDFSVADGYALYPLRIWQKVAMETLTPSLAAYQARIATRTAVKAALEAEGLS